LFFLNLPTAAILFCIAEILGIFEEIF
jgi:hypothetical protein